MADKDVLKIPTMQEYAVKLVGAAVGSGIHRALKGNSGGSMIAAARGSRAAQKLVKKKGAK